MWPAAEVRTPLNHIIKFVIDLFDLRILLIKPPNSYLEMALNGPLDIETRENLSMSHSASKVRRKKSCPLCLLIDCTQSLLFTINDLLVRSISCILHCLGH